MTLQLQIKGTGTVVETEIPEYELHRLGPEGLARRIFQADVIAELSTCAVAYLQYRYAEWLKTEPKTYESKLP